MRWSWPTGVVLGMLGATLSGSMGCAGCENPQAGVCATNDDCPDTERCVDRVCVSWGGGDDGGKWWESDGGGDAGSADAGADGGPDAGAGDGGAIAEICGNGIDDNGDTVIDEGCACSTGAVQTCWTGTAARRNKGVCRDGAQVCQTYGDIDAWGPCEGAVLPQAEVPGNGIDEDCDGADGLVVCTGAVEICGNSIDDECDGLTDCDDPDCRGSCTACDATETACNDQLDEDCDGFTDCIDPDCASNILCIAGGGNCNIQFFVEIPGITCGDGVDNDCDGKTDCGDSDCKNPGQCGCAQVETDCADSEDNDCDGFTDCADAECETCVPGTTRWCDEPAQCQWGRQDCDASARWGGCYEVMDAPSGCDPDAFYSLSCCLAANQCCENYPTDQQSRGNCTGIVTAACQ